MLKCVLVFIIASVSLLQAGVSPRFQYPPLNTLITNLEWQRDFVRKPISFNYLGKRLCWLLLTHSNPLQNSRTKFFDSVYLENHSHALMQFYDWYLNQSSSNFISLLKKQHALSCLGKTGDAPYQVIAQSRMGRTYQSSEAYPGQLRWEIPSTIPVIQHDIFLVPQKEMQTLVDTGEPWALKFKNSPFNAKEPLEVKGLEKKFWPILEIESDTEVKSNPPVTREHHEAFQKLMMVRMAELQKWAPFTHNEIQPKLDLFLNDLADYYHTAIQWMPFHHINNSLFMGQVNVLLRHVGYRTLAHENMDYLAIASGYQSFRMIFKRFFYAQNPQ